MEPRRDLLNSGPGPSVLVRCCRHQPGTHGWAVPQPSIPVSTVARRVCLGFCKRQKACWRWILPAFSFRLFSYHVTFFSAHRSYSSGPSFVSTPWVRVVFFFLCPVEPPLDVFPQGGAIWCFFFFRTQFGIASARPRKPAESVSRDTQICWNRGPAPPARLDIFLRGPEIRRTPRGPADEPRNADRS